MLYNKKMDRLELSNLAFLIRALVANPSRHTLTAAQNNMNFGGSLPFQASIALLRALIDNLERKGGSREDLQNLLSQEASRLSHKSKALEKSVGQALTWAIESNQFSSANRR